MTTTETSSELRPSLLLRMPSLAANVSVARQVLAGLGDALDLEASRSADMKIAITEAVTNCVVHAYGEGRGAVALTATTLPECIVISVRDEGVGFKPTMPATVPADPDTVPQTGYGLALIGSLSDEFAIMSGSAGTEVQMLFTLGEQPPPDAARIFAGTSQIAGAGADAFPLTDASADALQLVIAVEEPLTEVLGRTVSLLSARAGFSIDRLSDAQLVSDALGRHAPRLARDGALSLVVAEDEGAFELELGPFAANGGRGLVQASALPGVGGLLERLTDDLAVESAADGSETVRLRFSRH